MITVDSKAPEGSSHLTAKRWHLLSAVTHGTVVTLAQAEASAKTKETTHFRALLAPLNRAGTVVTLEAMYSVEANISWLVETKKAHITMIKTTSPPPTTRTGVRPWRDIRVQHTTS
jgi:hypothetical protein